jgi:hypothetical protein
MLKRPSELISQSNIKGLQTASATYRSLQSFCNYRKTVWGLASGVWRLWAKVKLLIVAYRLLTPDFRLQTPDFFYQGEK